MLVEDGPDAPWYAAGTYEFAVRRLAELDDVEAEFELIDLVGEAMRHTYDV